MPGNIINLTPADIAAWPTPNYIDPPRRTYMPAFASIWFAAGTLFVGTRFLLRAQNAAGKFGLDDIFLFGAWLVGIMFTVSSILVATYGKADRNIWNIPPTKFEDMTLIVWLGEFSYLLCSCLCRISVLLFYRRLTDGLRSRKWKMLVLGAITFTACWTLAFIIALFLNCRPFEAYWKAFDFTWHKEFTCTDTSVINALSGVFAVGSDLYAVLLPYCITWKLQMPRRQKLALHGIFSIGLVVVAASAVRTYYTVQVSSEADVSTAVFNVFVWSQVELQLSFICASTPSLRVLFRQYFMSSFSRSGRRTRDQSAAAPSSNNRNFSRPGNTQITNITATSTSDCKTPYISHEPNNSDLGIRASKIMPSYSEKEPERPKSSSEQDQTWLASPAPSTPTSSLEGEATFELGVIPPIREDPGRQVRSQQTHRTDEMLFNGREESFRSVV